VRCTKKNVPVAVLSHLWLVVFAVTTSWSVLLYNCGSAAVW